MTHAYLRDVWRQAGLSPGQRLVNAYLADLADDAGLAWPAVTTIATATGLSLRGARRIIRELEEKSRLRADWNRGRRTYFLSPPDITSGEDTMSGADTVSGGGHDVLGGRTLCPGGEDAMSGIPVIYPSSTPTTTARAKKQKTPAAKTEKPAKKERLQDACQFDPKTVEIPEWITQDLWVAWCEHREQLGKPLNDLMVSRLLAGLTRARELGHDPAGLLEDAIQKRWTGAVFERHRRAHPGNSTRSPAARTAPEWRQAERALVERMTGRRPQLDGDEVHTIVEAAHT